MPSDILSCTLPIGVVNDVLAKQESLLKEDIQLDLSLNEPYSNTIKGTTINLNNRGENIRSLISNRIVPAWSRVKPQFQRFTDTCNIIPASDQIGQTEFSTYMESLTGRGPAICVREAMHTVMNSLKTTTESLKIAIRELKGYDIRSQYLERSGLKFVAKSGKILDDILRGGRKNTNEVFYPELPDSTISLATLIVIASKMSTVIGAERFGSGMQSHFLVLAGDELIERIRNDEKVEKSILAQTQGGYADGVNSIYNYLWLDIQNRGLRFGLDMQPMRFNYLDALGQPILIEPEYQVTSDYGVDSRPNPDWSSARYEIGFIIGKDAFEYITPSAYTGEDKWKWAPQFTIGQLQWHNVKDMGCNFKGDIGFHWYEIVRAINPVKPHAICAFAYQRCNLDLGLESCELSTISS